LQNYDDDDFFSIAAIKTEPFTSYQMYSRVDPQALELPHESLHRDANNLDSQLKAHTLTPMLYHVVTNPDSAAVHEPTARYHEEEEEEEEDEEELFYPYRTNTLKNTDPAQFYHAWNQQQHHQGSPTTGCFPVQRHPAAEQRQLLYASLAPPHLPAHHPSISAHCLSDDDNAVLDGELRRLEESYRESYAAAALPEASDLFGACCLVAPRPVSYAHATVGPLGTSPQTQTPSPRSAQRRREATKMCAGRPEPCEHPPLAQREGGGSGRAWAGVVVVVESGGKAEQPAPVCLEDGE